MSFIVTTTSFSVGKRGKRIVNQASLAAATTVINTFNDSYYYEKDQFNIVKSGRQWFGERFDFLTEYNFTFKGYYFFELSV